MFVPCKYLCMNVCMHVCVYMHVCMYMYTALISKRVPNPSFEYAVAPLISKRAPRWRNSFLSVLRSGAPHF